VTTPFDLSQLMNMIMQLLPFIVILAILPMIIRMFTGAFRE
jgi:hypothetical protein